jgi:hypothetical protein
MTFLAVVMIAKKGFLYERKTSMSTWLMKFLFVEYLIILAMCIYEKNWARTLYWFGASVIQISILIGMK